MAFFSDTPQEQTMDIQVMNSTAIAIALDTLTQATDITVKQDSDGDWYWCYGNCICSQDETEDEYFTSAEECLVSLCLWLEQKLNEQDKAIFDAMKRLGETE